MKRYLIFLFCSFLSIESFGQQKAVIHPGRDGIYIFCGNELPGTFQYRISRREGAGDWKEIAVLRFPKNKTEWEGQLTEAALKDFRKQQPDSIEISFGWNKLRQNNILDSLYYLSANPNFQIAAGTGFWDREAKRGVKYQYKIERAGTAPNIKGTDSFLSDSYFWPGNPSSITAVLDTLITGTSNVEVTWLLSGERGMNSCRVFRSRYLKNEPFTEIHPSIYFTAKEKRNYVNILDNSVQDGAQYSYYIIPYDYFGNESKSSDTVNVYNRTINTMKALVKDFNGKSVEKENKIRLSWKINKGEPLSSISIYKAIGFDSSYFLLANVSPSDTAYDDFLVEPVTTYYYTLVLSTPYGKAFPSVRLPVVFKANKTTSFPPENLTAVRKGNVVKLQWEKNLPENRAYYIYRSANYTGQMTPIGQVVSGDPQISYTDTVGYLPASPVLAYAVAAENTSYIISPLSARVMVAGNTGPLPVLTIQQPRIHENNVELFWNADNDDVPGRGFLIERKEADEHYIPLKENKSRFFKTENVVINSFTDTTAERGKYYSYRVSFLSINDADTGAVSLPVGVFIPLDVPSSPNNITAIIQNTQVLLQWDLPLGDSWDEIRIYRASAGGTPALIKTLKADVITYTDNIVKKGENYFYWIATVKKGVEGRIAEPLGIRVE